MGKCSIDLCHACIFRKPRPLDSISLSFSPPLSGAGQLEWTGDQCFPSHWSVFVVSLLGHVKSSAS